MSVIFNKFFLAFLAGMFLISCTYFKQNKGEIIINNQTPYPVSEVSVKYKSSERVDLIGVIAPNSIYTYTLEYSDSEESVYVNYTDKDKVIHSDNVVPYGGKYDKKTYTFNIK